MTDEWVCAAGRTAFFGGKWKFPCFEPTEHEHVVVSGLMEIYLCDKHFAEANAAGFITSPYVSREVAEHMAKEERREMGLVEPDKASGG